MAMTGEKAALALVGVGEVFQIMASMLPSPTTMMQGGGDPDRIKQLRRNRMQGAVMSTLLLGGVAYFVGEDDKAQGWILFLAGMSALGVFMYESNRALKIAADGFGEDGGY